MPGLFERRWEEKPLTFSHVEVQNVRPRAISSQRYGSDAHRVVSWAEVGETDASLSPIRLPGNAFVLLALVNEQDNRRHLQAGAKLKEVPLAHLMERRVNLSWVKST